LKKKKESTVFFVDFIMAVRPENVFALKNAESRTTPFRAG